MNIDQLNQDLKQLAISKTELSKLNYSSEEYDKLEEDLHDLEDEFQEKYGDYLEEALSDVHDEYCSDNDVLLPIAYMAKKYSINNGKFDVAFDQGVIVDADDYPGKGTRLVLIPSPTRIVLLVDKNIREEVWKAKE